MIERKVARICWNTQHWQKPSGKKGKSKNKKAYENLVGYGHEEWLFDSEKTINGFHYSHLQAIVQHRNKYLGATYDIYLYSINSLTKERWWLGCIKNVQIVSPKESETVYAIYKEKGWLTEMEGQLEEVGVDLSDFRKIPTEYFSTIKYRVEDLELLDPPRQFAQNDPVVKSNYYNLKNWIGNPAFIDGNDEFLFTPGHQERPELVTVIYDSQNKPVDLPHNRMQTNIYRHLTEIYGEANVGTEQNTGIGPKIDIVVKENRHGEDAYIFYELKTSNSLRQCIREALSQLLEYAYYHDPHKNIIKLIIVSHNKITEETKCYLQLLRDRFQLPIYYQRYDPEKEQLDFSEY